MSHYENGLREPGLPFLDAACRYYGVSADYLLGRSPLRTSLSEVMEQLPEPCAGEVSELLTLTLYRILRPYDRESEFTLDREEAAAVLSARETLSQLGFEADDMGDGSVMLRRIPADLDPGDAEAALAEFAGHLLSGKLDKPETARDELLHTVACKAAIKAGKRTSEQELLALAEQVLSREDLKYCPHGRPICVTLTRRQLEKQFKRIQ